MQKDMFANGLPCKDVFEDGQVNEHANMCSQMDGQMSIHFLQIDKHVNQANVQARRNV